MTFSRSEATPALLPALPVETARRRLAAAGLSYRLRWTGPPDRTLVGPARVLAVRPVGDSLVLVVARGSPLWFDPPAAD